MYTTTPQHTRNPQHIDHLGDCTLEERRAAYAVAAHAACDARTALRALRYGVRPIRGARLRATLAAAIETVTGEVTR